LTHPLVVEDDAALVPGELRNSDRASTKQFLPHPKGFEVLKIDAGQVGRPKELEC